MSVNVLGSLSGGVSPAGDRGKVGNAQGWFAAGGELGRHAFARNGLRRNRRGSAERSCGRIGFQFDQKWFSWGEIGFICVGFWRFCAAPGEGRGEKSPRNSAPFELAALRRARGLRHFSLPDGGAPPIHRREEFTTSPGTYPVFVENTPSSPSRRGSVMLAVPAVC